MQYILLYDINGDQVAQLKLTDWMRQFLQNEFVLSCERIDLDGTEHYRILDTKKEVAS